MTLETEILVGNFFPLLIVTTGMDWPLNLPLVGTKDSIATFVFFLLLAAMLQNCYKVYTIFLLLSSGK